MLTSGSRPIALLKRREAGPELVGGVGSGTVFLFLPDFRLDLAFSEVTAGVSDDEPGSGMEVDIADKALALACLVTRTEGGGGGGSGGVSACEGTGASTFCRFDRRLGEGFGVS